MTETNGQQPLRNISHSWCFYNRSPIKLNALDDSKYMYKALGTFLSSRCSKIEKKPDRKDIEHDMEVGNFKIVETFHRQLRPSTQIQRAAKVQKRKYNDITQSENPSAENLYLTEKIPKRLKASNSLSDISWCSLDDANSECFQKSRSSNVLKRQPLDSKLYPLPTEDYRRKLRSSHSMVEAHKNCESTQKHSLLSSYSGNSNGSGSYTDRSYASDLEVICEFQCRPIFVILEKLSKHKIKQLTSVGNLRMESVGVTRAMDSNKVAEPVDVVNTKNVATDNEASYLAARKSFDKFLNSSCMQNVEVTDLPKGKLSDQLEHMRHDLEKVAADVIDVSSSPMKFDKCFGMGRFGSKKNSLRLIDIENESKELVCAKDHIVEKLKFHQVQDTDRTATPVSSTVCLQLESKYIEKKPSRDIMDSISPDANIELPLKHNSTPLGDHVDNCSVLLVGDDMSSSSESTIDLSDEWTSAEHHKIMSDDIDLLQISDPTCNQDVSKLSDSTRLLRGVSMSDRENLGLPNCISNGNVGNLLMTLESRPEQHGCCTAVKSKKSSSKINSRPVRGRKRSGPHRNGSKWGNGQRDYRYSNNSCGDNRNNGNNLSRTDNNRNGSGDSQSNCGSQRRSSCENYSFGDAKKGLKEKKDHSTGKNNLCANRNISCTDIKLSYLGTIDTLSERGKEKGKESVLCESDSDSDESLFKNCSKFSSSGFSDTATAEERMDEDHLEVLDVVEDERDLSDLYVPNFMTHSPHLHRRDDSVNEWRRVADLEEWWLNDRVNFEPSLESQISVLQEDECQCTNAENERRPLAANAFQWCAMLADQSEWPDIDFCCFHDEVNVDGYHFNTAKGLCVNKNKVATSMQDVVFYSAENGKFQTDRLSETADSFVAESKLFNHSICQMSEKQQISLDAVNELSLKTRNKSSFLDSEPDIRVKLDSGIFNASGATDVLCLTNAKSEAIKSDSFDKFTGSSAAISRDFNSNYDHNVSKMHDYNPSFASNGDESRLRTPFLASHASQSYFPSFQMLSDAHIRSAVPINNVATVNSHNDIKFLEVSSFTTSVQNAYKPATEPCCRAVLSSVCSPLLGSAACDQTFLGPAGSCISKDVSRNHTSAAASFSHICPSPVYDHVVISQMQAVKLQACSHNSSHSSFVNTCYASLCQHNSSMCSNSSSCSLLNQDISVACSLVVSSNVSLPKESSCSNLGFGQQPVLDFPCSRKFLDNANSFSAYDQKPCYPVFTASCSEITSNCLSDSTSQPSEAKFPSFVSSADDRNLDIINALSNLNSPGMIRDSWSSLVCSEATPNAKVCKRALQQNELKTSKCYSNDLPASEGNLLLSERSDDTIRTQSTLAEYNLKSSHKTCMLNEDPVISNDSGSTSYDDCNSDMCSWLAASMGLYTCICGAAFSDSWSCLQHQFKCSVMIKQ